MARSTTPLPPRKADLSLDQMKRGVDRLKRRVADLEAFEPTQVRRRDDAQVTALETSIEQTLSDIFGPDTVEFRRFRRAASLDNGPRSMTLSSDWMGGRGGYNPDNDIVNVHRYLDEGKNEAIALLQQAINGLKERIDEHGDPPLEERGLAVTKPKGREIFVVHGQDEAGKQGLARFLEKLEMKAIILHEQPSKGMTIIEKFEQYANQVAFAVVLMTPDDLGGLAAASSQDTRARQNVIFELGYFVGKLGRGKVCLLRKGHLEIPSDLQGVIYTEMDPGDGWKLNLIKELKAAGLEFDANKAWS